jgi:hypothetical protein
MSVAAQAVAFENETGSQASEANQKSTNSHERTQRGGAATNFTTDGHRLAPIKTWQKDEGKKIATGKWEPPLGSLTGDR